MADQYIEAAGDERFAAAVDLTLERWADAPESPLRDIAARAVLECFCACVGEAEDEIEERLSSVHIGLIDEVADRANRSAGGHAPPVRSERERADAVVERASEQSFPCSDPPAWIHGTSAGGHAPPVRSERERADAVVERASEQSFPCSDPPAWIYGKREG